MNINGREVTTAAEVMALAGIIQRTPPEELARNQSDWIEEKIHEGKRVTIAPNPLGVAIFIEDELGVSNYFGETLKSAWLNAVAGDMPQSAPPSLKTP